MGFYNALNACFTLHELNHSHWAQVNDDGYPVAKEDSGIPELEGRAAHRAGRQGQGARRVADGLRRVASGALRRL